MGETMQPAHTLAATLRGLRVGFDDNLTVRRTINLAAAKIENLERTVSQLTAELERAGGK